MRPSGYLTWAWLDDRPPTLWAYVETLKGEHRLRVGKLMIVLVVRWS